MTKFFMYESDQQDLEQLMMLVPNFLPRRSGVVVMQRIKNQVESIGFERSRDFVLEFCKSNISDRGMDSVRGGEIYYEDIIKRCFEKNKGYRLNKRLDELVHTYTGEVFINQNHESRFRTVCRIQDEDIYNRHPIYLATLFLLTAHDKLWCVAKDHIYIDSFDFQKMHLKGMNTDAYAIYQMARTIYYGKEYIQLNEIADKHLIGEKAFKAIIHSILLVKFGATVFQLDV